MQRYGTGQPEDTAKGDSHVESRRFRRKPDEFEATAVPRQASTSPGSVLVIPDRCAMLNAGTRRRTNAVCGAGAPCGN